MLRRSILSTSIFLTITSAMIALSGCGGKNGLIGNGGGASLTAVSMTPTNPTLTLSLSPPATRQFVAIGQYSFGNPQDITNQLTWVSADTTVATMDSLAYTTGRGTAAVSQDPSSLVIAQGLVTVTMVNPSTTSVFPWPIGSIFQLHGLTVSSGDVSLLNDTPFSILIESDPANSQQPCKPGLECVIKFVPAVPQPATGTYTVTGGTGQASALITATMNVIVNSVLTQVSGSATLTVQ